MSQRTDTGLQETGTMRHRVRGEAENQREARIERIY